MDKLLQEIEINTSYITLGQVLKLTDAFESGGYIKSYLQTNGVDVNEEREHRRGRKLYDGDIISLDSGAKYIVKQSS